MEQKQVPDIVKSTFLVTTLPRKSVFDFANWIDQLKAVVSVVPNVGGFLAEEIDSVCTTLSEYRAYEFFRKFTCFIVGVSDLSMEQREKFVVELEQKAQDTSGNVITGMVERLDNINKEKILANLVIARVEEKISIDDFFRLSSVLERIHYVDLSKLLLYQCDYYDEDGDSELLFATGVLQQSLIDEKEGNKYTLSKLGAKLLKYGCRIDVTIAHSIGKKVKNMIDLQTAYGENPISEKDFTDLIDEHLKKKAYDASDQAMFDFDVARGK